MAFAPTAAIFLLIDLIKNYKDKNAWKNVFLLGGCVLVLCFVLLYQNIVLFGENSDSSIKISFMRILRRYNEHPFISLIQSVAFPLFVLICNFKTVIKNRKYRFSLILNTFGISETLFLQETGSREMHGNFDWGYSFTIMIAFIMAVAIIKNYAPQERKKLLL